MKWIETEVKLGDLKPFEQNPRKISKEAFNRLVKSLEEDGYHQRILMNWDNTIVGGHQRIKALKRLGVKNSDLIKVLKPEEELNPDEFLRINIRDNGEFGNYDVDMLANFSIEIEQLIDWGVPEDLFGGMLGEEEIEELEGEDEAPEVDETNVTTVLGDLWLLGEHRLLCGDSASVTDVEKLMDGHKINLLFTDPPYGINVVQNKSVGGSKAFGSVRGNNIIKANKYMPIKNDDSTQVAIDVINICLNLDISIMCIWGANHYASALPDSQKWIVWDKNTTGNFADCELAWTNLEGRVQKFTHTWNGLIKASENNQKRVHPTQKPVALAEWFINEFGDNQSNVLDLFGGSGSTLIACEKTKRKAFLMELEPHYCDVIIKRWQEITGMEARHSETGKTFKEMSNGR